MVHLDEFPRENGYQSYLFEELQPYDAQILEEEYNNWLKAEKNRHFYLTGDCHGDFKKIDFFCQNHDTGKDDVMIILGDAGINYWLDKTDQKVKKHLSGLPINFLVVHGNHEARASEIGSYKERKWMGGTV